MLTRYSDELLKHLDFSYYFIISPAFPRLHWKLLSGQKNSKDSKRSPLFRPSLFSQWNLLWGRLCIPWWNTKSEGVHRDHGECLFVVLNTEYQQLMRIWDLMCTLEDFQKMMKVVAHIQQWESRLYFCRVWNPISHAILPLVFKLAPPDKYEI